MSFLSFVARRLPLRGAAIAVFALLALPGAAQAFSSERIVVTASGTGRDVVLVPGLDSSGRVWDALMAEFEGYRFHIVDIAGFAGRDAGANGAGPVLDPVADEVARYIAQAGLDDPALIGHSMGGLAALMVAAREPELLDRVMVVDSPAFVGAIMGPPGMTAEAVEPIAGQMRADALAGDPEARAQQVGAQVAGWVRDADAREMLIADALASDAAVSAQAMYDILTTDLRPQLAQIEVPVSVVFVTPAGTAMSAEETTAFYAAQYDGVEVLTLEHVEVSGHFVMLDQPERLAAIVRSFME